MDCVPLVGFVPLQSPVAAQDVAFAVVQVRVEAPFCRMDAGLAESATAGGGFAGCTFTVTALLDVPPAPLQANAYVAVAEGATVSDPDTGRAPVQAPDAVQPEAPEADHCSTVLPPTDTIAGIADSATVGAGVTVGGSTVTLTDCIALPPLPEHVKANDDVVESGPEAAVPDAARAPVQLPEAVHPVAFVVDQDRVTDSPGATDDGVTESVSVGAGGDVGDWVTLAVTVCAAAPPEPLQLSV